MGVSTAAVIIGILLIGGFIVYMVMDPTFMASCAPGQYITPDGHCCPNGYYSDGTKCVEGIGGSGPSAPLGTFRNCIKQVMQSGPDCSDTSDRKMPTTCNGRDMGQMTYIDAWNRCR